MPAATRFLARTATISCLALLAFSSTGNAQACDLAASARPQAAGIYVGSIGTSSNNGNNGTSGTNDAVVVSLHNSANTAQPCAASPLNGSYHHASGADQEVYELTGNARAGNITLRGSGAPSLRKRSGRFEGSASADGATITGTWIAADGRRQPFALQRVAAWTTLAVQAKGGVRSCERPQFTEARYQPVNRELAEACDYFLADGQEGPGTLRLEIDSLGQYMVAAVAYAKSGGRELPPEIIAVDLGKEDVAQAHGTTLASRP